MLILLCMDVAMTTNSLFARTVGLSPRPLWHTICPKGNGKPLDKKLYMYVDGHQHINSQDSLKACLSIVLYT